MYRDIIIKNAIEVSKATRDVINVLTHVSIGVFVSTSFSI